MAIFGGGKKKAESVVETDIGVDEAPEEVLSEARSGPGKDLREAGVICKSVDRGAAIETQEIEGVEVGKKTEIERL